MSDRVLARLERDTFGYFVGKSNRANGLVADNTREDAPASLAAVGLGLAAYAVAAERGFISRAETIERTLTTLRFFHDGPQGVEPDAIGYNGFYYHFFDMRSGRRTWESEISTMDTTILLAGALTAAAYFDRDTKREREIRELADVLYRRADWEWALNGGDAVSHGWKPEAGFLDYRWEGYNEALVLYILGLGSPTHPLPSESYRAWTRTYEWMKLYDIEFLYAAPLFVHQLSHIWIDFRSIQDEFMRGKSIDYFENSRRATYVQQQYAIENPRAFAGYERNCWGITASDGPGPATRRIAGVERRFYDYCARGVPFGPDDGTIAPWGAVASLPFAPDIVLGAIDHFNQFYPYVTSEYGFKCSFNPTFSSRSRKPRAGGRSGGGSPSRSGTDSKSKSHRGLKRSAGPERSGGDGSVAGGWISKGYYGLDQGPVVLMIENYRSGLLWRLMRGCPPLVTGLKRAGFRGGWLGD